MLKKVTSKKSIFAIGIIIEVATQQQGLSHDNRHISAVVAESIKPRS